MHATPARIRAYVRSRLLLSARRVTIRASVAPRRARSDWPRSGAHPLLLMTRLTVMRAVLARRRSSRSGGSSAVWLVGSCASSWSRSCASNAARYQGIEVPAGRRATYSTSGSALGFPDRRGVNRATTGRNARSVAGHQRRPALDGRSDEGERRIKRRLSTASTLGLYRTSIAHSRSDATPTLNPVPCRGRQGIACIQGLPPLRRCGAPAMTCLVALCRPLNIVGEIERMLVARIRSRRPSHLRTGRTQL